MRLVIPIIVTCAAGCMSLTTTQVRLHDPQLVSLDLLHDGGRTRVLESGSGVATATVQQGKLYVPFHSAPYKIQALRDAAGELRLHCDGCGEASYYGKSNYTLVSASGELQPSTLAPTRLEDSSFVVPYLDAELCFASQKHRIPCQVGMDAELLTPASNVLSVTRDSKPSRLVGGWLTGLGAAALAMGGYFMTMNMTPGHRAVVAGIPLTLGAISVGVGLWDLLVPATHSVTDAQGAPISP